MFCLRYPQEERAARSRTVLCQEIIDGAPVMIREPSGRLLIYGPREQSDDLGGHALGKRGDFVVGRRRQRVEGERAASGHEDTVGDGDVVVEVEGQGAAKSLLERHGAYQRLGDAAPTGPAPQQREDRPHEQPNSCRALFASLASQARR